MIENLLFAVVFVAVVLYFVHAARKKGATAAAARTGGGVTPAEKGEALFVSMFPELQPHFHPEKLVSYVAARRGRTPARGGYTWKDAPGFGGPAVDIRFEGDREECSLVDPAGKALARFRFEARPDGGVLRVGEGKLTVDLRDDRDPAVRYWHPEREFKWTRRAGWRFRTPVADKPFDSDDRGTSWSDTSSSSSSSDGLRTTAAAAGFAGLGGTFDAGGASAGWEAGPADSVTAGSGDAAVAATDSGSDAGADTGGDSGGDSGSDPGSDSGSDSGSTSY